MVQLFLHGQCHILPIPFVLPHFLPKSAHYQRGELHPHTWFLGPIWISIKNGVSIESGVFPEFTFLTYGRTEWLTSRTNTTTGCLCSVITMHMFVGAVLLPACFGWWLSIVTHCYIKCTYLLYTTSTTYILWQILRQFIRNIWNICNYQKFYQTNSLLSRYFLNNKVKVFISNKKTTSVYLSFTSCLNVLIRQ